MTTPRLPLAALLAALAIVASGCGGTSDEKLATDRVKSFLTAMEHRDDARACAMMTPELQEGISSSLRPDMLPGDCRTRAAHVLSSAKAPGNTEATIVKMTVSGSRATATLTATSKSNVAAGPIESDVHLEKRGGRWLIANF